MPISRAVRMMRQAISPRLAMRRELIMGAVLVRVANSLDDKLARARPRYANDLKVGGTIGKHRQQTFDKDSVAAIKGCARKRRIVELAIENEQPVGCFTHRITS